MKTRQLVLNDAGVSAYVKKRFVGVAASDVAYNHLPEEAKRRGEYQFLSKALSGAPHGIHQGIYLVTPSGKYLKQANVGWPSPDPVKALAILREAVAAYEGMPKSERLAASALPNNERSMAEGHDVIPDDSWLKIRTVTRSYPFAGMDLFDLRHPVYYKLDRLWLTEESARSLLPAELKVGQKAPVGKQVLRHLTYDGHQMLGCPPWWDETVKISTMEVKIVAEKGSRYELRYVGQWYLDSDTQYNKSSYRGDLLGKAVWDESKKKFLSLKWVALGERNRKELKSNETKGKVHVTKVGAVFELDPMHANDRGISPHRWEDAYPKAMKQGCLSK